jgi:opacity protein-like surface antigen
MKKNLIKPLLLMAAMTTAEMALGQNQKWQLSVQLQPEMTFHKDRYTWWGENSNKSTFNIGVTSAVQYNINKSFFVSAGLGFISRTLRTANFLDQGALPPPKRSGTFELVTTESVAYRLIPLTTLVGYNFIAKDKFRSFVTGGFSANYLLNTSYKSNFDRYDGAYKKQYWQGYSLTAGLGADYNLTKKLQATASVSYAMVNQVKQDEYISNQDSNGLTLAHNYLNFNFGIKLLLQNKESLKTTKP